MKKTIVKFVVIVVLSFTLIVAASAASYQGPAVQLNQLGLFLGTDTGFSLERAPTRAEAVTMLVRLLGLESAAESGSYSHPFTDLVAWQVPYVSLAYDMGLTTGTSDTTFNPGGLCTAQMYATFVARALGYSDNDVTTTLWAEAINFGMGIGILDDNLNVAPFLRGHMVAVSYLALYVPTSDGAFDTLLAKLVSDGAVTAAAAADAVAYLALINEYNAVGSSYAALPNIDISVDLSYEIAMLGETVPITSSMDMAVIGTTSAAQRAIKHNFANRMMGISVDREIYTTDGFIYQNMRNQKTRISIADSAGISLNELFAISDAVKQVASSVYRPYMVGSLAKGTESGQTVYSARVSADNVDSIIQIVIGMSAGLGELAPNSYSGSLNGDIAMKTYVNAAGEPVKIVMAFNVGMIIDGLEIEADVDLVLDINATGSNVRVEFPSDLDQYR